MSACRTIIHGWFRPFLYFAKPAFSEMLPTSNTIPHAPLFCQGPFLSRASPREQHAAPMGSAQSRRQPQKPHNHPKSSGSGKLTRAESAAAPRATSANADGPPE